MQQKKDTTYYAILPFQAYRCLVLSTFIACVVHEVPTMQFWVTNVSSLHSILALVQVFLHWSVLLINFILNWRSSREINTTVDNLLSLSIILPQTAIRQLCKIQMAHFALNGVVCVIYHIIGNALVWENENYAWYTTIIYVASEYHIGYSNILFVQLVLLLREHFKVGL